MIIKKSYAIQMSYDFTNNEKLFAEKAILRFNYCSRLMDRFSKYLNIINTPFKDSPDMTTEQILEKRVLIRKFRNQSLSKFKNFQDAAFKSIHVMKNFSSDTQIIKLMKSFISSISELQFKIKKFNSLFDDLEDKEFSKNLVSNIEDIKKDCEDINKLIEERIKNHIETNILSKNWTNEIGNELQIKIEKQTPLIMELSNQRQKELNSIINDRSTLENIK